MGNEKMLKTGMFGTGILLILCFTPVMIVVLGVVGLPFLVGMLDIFLLPLLAIFVGLTGYALWQRRKTRSA